MKIDRSIVLFVAAVALLSVSSGIFETSSNNYYADVFSMTGEQRGALELPREFPGFMVAVATGALFFVAEPYLGALAAGLVAAGLLGLTAFAMRSDQYAAMLAFLIVWSAGTHLLMPVRSSLALALARQSDEGAKLGKLASVSSLAVMAGAGTVWLVFGRLELGFRTAFVAAAACAAVGAVVMLGLGRAMGPVHHGPRPKLVYRRRYRLFYTLSVLYGARKQVFITFGPWVLIRIFDREPQHIASMWFIANLVVLFALPTVGRLVDRVGERAILMADGLLLIFVCLTYGFAGTVLPQDLARMAVCAAYVLDLSLLPVQMARSTYLSKIAASRSDLSGALALSVSIDHAVSIPVALAGGVLWDTYDYQYVFVGAACVAVAILIASSFVRVQRIEHPELVESPAEGLEQIRQEEV
jgi:predicted MFS family arabinose efflux permease